MNRDDVVLLCGFILGNAHALPDRIESAIGRLLLSDHIPDVTKKVKPAEIGGGNHFVEGDKMVEDVSKNNEELNTSGEHDQELNTSETKKYVKLTADQKEEAVLRYNAGETVTQIHESFGCSAGPVTAALKAAGVKMRPNAIQQRQLDKKGADRQEFDTTVPKIKPYASIDDEGRVQVVAPRKDSDPDTLIQEHSEYLGERTDGTLEDKDWGDIQKMRYNGLPDARIAKSYGIGLDYLQRFANRMEQRDKLGN